MNNQAAYSGRWGERSFELLYNMLMDSIPCSVMVLDRRLHVVAANSNFLEKARRDLQDTIGKQIAEVLPEAFLKGADLERTGRRVLESRKAMRGQRLTFRAPGSPPRIYYLSLLPMADGDQPDHVMLVMEDITEQVRLGEEAREAERHLARVVESASDLVISTCPQGKVLSWNGTAQRLTDRSREEAEGQPFSQLIVQEHVGVWRETLARLEAGEETVRKEWSIQAAGGAEVPVSWVCSCIRDDHRIILGVVAVGRDLSELRKMEVQVLQAQRISALGIMAGGIAHEIRNPLTVARSACTFLQDTDGSPAFEQECIEHIQIGINRAFAAIDNLMRFVRPLEQELSSVELVDLAALIDECISTTRNELKRVSIDVKVSRPPEPVLVNGKASTLQMVLINLLLNAVKAMPTGGVLELGLNIKRDHVQVTVTDHGCGIPRKDLDRIFDPFYTLSRLGEGVGLGLAFCYNAVKDHFGHLEVESTMGEGTTFTISLPSV